ncbi:hypothetical protein NJB1728e18_40770, partial [Mycobacterium marinum]
RGRRCGWRWRAGRDGHAVVRGRYRR